MNRLLLAGLALALAAVSPAAAEYRPHGPGSAPSHPAMHVQRQPMSHARLPRRSAAHFHATAHRAAHRAVRSSSRRPAHYPARHSTRHLAHHATHRAISHAPHHAARHAVKHTGRHAVRRAGAPGVKGRFARVQKAVFARRRFHAGGYRSPRGWFAHHWVLGERLPRPWFVRDYWIMDWQIYGLWAPVDGLIWVRVGNDAVLIDPDTGEVIGIEYDVFW